MKFWGAFDLGVRLVSECSARFPSFVTFGSGEYGHLVHLGGPNSPTAIRRGVCTHASGLVVAWAGRFLQMRRQQIGGSSSFGTQLAESYLRHGVEVWSDISGEFAIAIWDAVKRELLLARDCLGAIPLYYARGSNGAVCFGDHSGLLANQFGLASQVDERHIVSKMCCLPSEPGSTCFSKVKSVPPGCFATFIPNGAQVVRYWRVQSLDSRSNSEWIHAFREQFEFRISQVTDIGAPIAVALSGGLDSSSVVRTTCKFARSGVHAFTYRLDGIAESDELRYARAAVSGTASTLTVIDSFMEWPLAKLLRVAVEPDAIERFAPIATISSLASELGCVAMLTGTYGNLVGGDDCGWRLHFANSQRFAQLAISLLGSRNGSIGQRLRALLLTQFEAKMPSILEIIRARRRLSRGGMFGSLMAIGEEIRRGHACHARELEYFKICSDPTVPLGITLHNCAELIGSTVWHSGLAVENLTGMPIVDPFADAELLRIATSIPWSLRHGKLGDRILLRSAMLGTVPSSNLARVRQSTYNELYSRQHRAMLAKPEIRNGVHLIGKVLGTDWIQQWQHDVPSTFPILDAIHRAGLIGAWLEMYRSQSSTPPVSIA